MAGQPRPAWPDEFGLTREPSGEDIEEVEPANLLANEARRRLLDLGFNDTQIVEWAAHCVDAVGEDVSVDEFVDWIARTQAEHSG